MNLTIEEFSSIQQELVELKSVRYQLQDSLAHVQRERVHFENELKACRF